MSHALRRLLVVATVSLLPAVVLAGAWRLGGVSALEDDLIYYLPTRQYIAERIHAGEFPLWNPLVAMGTSVAADPQSGLWYPPTYLFVLLPPLIAYPASLILHFALAGGGMYRFLRACRRDWRAALLGAVAFEFCGFLVAHRAHLTIHHATAWLPWILYGWQRFAERGRTRQAVLASAAFGVQLLVQHIQVSIITAVVVTGYVAAVLVRWRAAAAGPVANGSTADDQRAETVPTTRTSRPYRRLREWWIYPAGMTAGAMLAGIQLIPTWQQYVGSVRGVPSYYLFNENSWLPTSATLLLFPMLQGARTPNALWSEVWWGPSHFCEQSAYGSILMLILAVASLRLLKSRCQTGDGPLDDPSVDAWQFLRGAGSRVGRYLLTAPAFPGFLEAQMLARRSFRRKLWPSLCTTIGHGWNREVLFWWLACALALLIAVGDLTPLGRLLFQLPVYRSLRVPARWILVWSVAMPILGSLVVSIVLRSPAGARRIAGAVQFTAIRALPAAAAVCLLLLFVAAEQADDIAAAFPTPKAGPKIAGLLLATRLGNAAILWPLFIMIATVWALRRWLQSRSHGAFALMVGVFLADTGAVAGLVDVDVRTYTRRDLTEPPPLVAAIQKLSPGPGDRLLVPRLESDYERPLEVLWPQTNLRYGLSTFNGYGPLGSLGSRMLFRFMPWGSSEEMLALLRNDALLRAMGVRFIAVRSRQERKLLLDARLPAGPVGPADAIAGSDQMRPASHGKDLLWGPVAIRAPGLYELSLDVIPVKNTPSRWFLRLEKTCDRTEIDQTRTIDPADMAAGPRRMRFLYYFEETCPAVSIRVKSEIGEALSAGRATLRQVTVEPVHGQAEIAGARTHAPDTRPAVGERFVHRADLPGGVSLYELPGTRPLVYWATRVESASNLVTAVDCIEHQSGSSARGDEATVVEQPAGSPAVPDVKNGHVLFSRPVAHRLQATAASATGGLLVFNESHDSGWTAAVDGQSVALLRVNAVCQGVLVPPGEHEVVFTYSPPGLTTGITLSVLGLLAFVVALAATLVWSHR